jgi:hypothetical protein
LTGDAGFTVSLKAAATAVSSYELTWPTDQGAAFTTLQNNGSGVLTWAAAGAITALSGDVTASGTGTVVATIANAAVTNAKLANVATQTFKGRTTAGTGSPEDLTITQATALLNTFTSGSNNPGLKGLVTAPLLADVAKFLRGDGVWATPAGGGDVTGPGSSVNTGIATWSGTSGTALLSNNLTIAGQTISTPTTGTPTPVVVVGGSATGAIGGALHLFGGGSSSSGGGNVFVTAGLGLFTGGSVTIAANNGGSSGGAGGSVGLLGGNGSLTNNAGGPITLTAGDATTTGLPGSIILTAGNPGAGGDGANIILAASYSNVGPSGYGVVRIVRALSTAVRLQFEAATSGTVSIKGPAGTITSYELTWPTAQGVANSFLKNDGAGALSWSTGSLVTGPGSSNTTAFATYTDTTGSVLSNNTLTLSATNLIKPIDAAVALPVSLAGGNATTSTENGGLVTISGGLPGVTGIGGSVLIQAVRGGLTSGAGGNLTFAAGPGFGTPGAGGYISLVAGQGSAADGGRIDIFAGESGNGGSFAGGSVTIRSGGGTGSNGFILVAGAEGYANIVPGTVTVRGGNVNSGSNSNGGVLNLLGGFAFGNALSGGAVNVTGGLGSNGGCNGGPVVITGGAAATTGTPGPVTIAGAGFGTGGTIGADVILRGGRGSTLANDGVVQITRTSTDNRATRLQFVADDANTVSIKAPATATSYALTLPGAQGAASTFLQNNGSGGLTWAVSSGSSSAQNLVMALKETTNLKVTEVTGGGMYFDPVVVPGTVTLRLVGNYSSVDAASSARVYLYDMGPGTGVFVPVRRSVVSIPFASVGAQMKIDQALIKVTTPGVDLNEIHDVARVYELRLYLNATDASPAMTVAWAGFVVV